MCRLQIWNYSIKFITVQVWKGKIIVIILWAPWTKIKAKFAIGLWHSFPFYSRHNEDLSCIEI